MHEPLELLSDNMYSSGFDKMEEQTLKHLQCNCVVMRGEIHIKIQGILLMAGFGVRLTHQISENYELGSILTYKNYC